MWGTKTKALIAGLLLVAAMVIASTMAAAPAHAASKTFTVNSTADTEDATPDGTCNSCTLREAIQEANANGNPSEVDRINFNIPGTGVKTIFPGPTLPHVTEPVVINGYSQPGSSVNTLARGTNAKLLVQLNGTKAFGKGLFIEASNSVVKGLVINNFPGIPIEIAPDDNPSVTNEVVKNVRIEGNFVGTDPTGTLDKGNAGGVDLFAASNNTVGGTTLASRNLLSGSDFAGVFIEGGTAFGQGRSDNNEVRGNLIGTQRDGIKPLGNDIQGVGVLDDAEGNSILSNSIFANGGLGIQLSGAAANDPGDADAGPNGLQNKPSLGAAKTISGKTTIKGTLSSSPGATYTIQFFSNPQGTDEGRTFLGQKTDLAVDGSGKGFFTFSPATKVAVGQSITATATNEFTGDTSEFSGTRTVASS